MMNISLRQAAVTIVLILCVSSLGAHKDKPEEGVDHKLGKWGEWGPLSPCSVTCGPGTTNMERVWIPGTDELPSKVPFTSTQMFSCTDETYPECPQNGTWSAWGSWSGCTKACGGGLRERHRDCRGVMYGGKPCEGDKFNKEDCNRDPCPPLPKNFNISQCTEDNNFTCVSKKMCVPLSHKCDSTVQCHDGSDEEDCIGHNTSRGGIRYDLNMGRNDAWSMVPIISVVLVSHSFIVPSILLMSH